MDAGEKKMVSSQDQKKYSSLVKLIFIKRLMRRIIDEVDKSGARKILDIGCGEGYPDRCLLDRFGGKLEILGIDFNPDSLELAQMKNPEAKYQKQNIYKLKFAKNQFDLILMTEVLEHLDNPLEALLKINSFAPTTLVSVPYEPWFSVFSFLSGSYLKRLGKHPDHISFWNKESLRDILSKAYSEVNVSIFFPWLIGVCKK